MQHWTCTLCKKEMAKQCRKEHLSGKRHTAMAAKAHQQTDIPPKKAQKPKKRWNFTTCKTKMHSVSKDKHLSGKPHATVDSRTRFPNGKHWKSSPTTDHMPQEYSGVSGITNSTIYATSDIVQVHGTMAVLVWLCTTCGCYVPQSSKQFHKSSFDHVKRLLEALKSTCTAISQARMQLSREDFAVEDNIETQVLQPLYYLSRG